MDSNGIPANRKVVVIGGGTVSHVRSHMALCAPAFGSTARRIHALAMDRFDKMDHELHLTRMAGGVFSLEAAEATA